MEKQKASEKETEELSKEIEDIKNRPEILEQKNIVIEINKKSLERLNSRIELPEKRVSELKDETKKNYQD